MSLMSFLNGDPSRQQQQSTSSSSGVESSSSSGQASSSQSLAFGDLFRELFANAGGAAGKVAGMIPGLADQVGQLFNGGLDTLKNLNGGTGAEYIDSRLKGPGTVDQSVAALGSDLGDFFNTQLNPALRLGAAAGGTLGGDRSEVARGTAAGQVAKSFASGAASLRAADQNGRDALASTLLNNRTANAGVTLSSLPALSGLAEAGASSQLLPYTLLAQIMGTPTVLGQSQSTQESSSYGTQSSTSQSTGSGVGQTGGILDAWAKFWSPVSGGGGRG